MINEKKIDAVVERFYNRFNAYNTKVLKKMGETVKKFDGVTPMVAYQLQQELKYGSDLRQMIRELARITRKTEKELYEAFDYFANENVEASKIYFEARNMEYVPYKDNPRLKQIAEAVKEETGDLFRNLSNTSGVGFVTINKTTGQKEFKSIERAYNELIDEAVYNVSIGVQDYQSAMRKVLTQMADSGVKVHEDKILYKSGYNRRIDSAVKQNILTGVRKINIDIQREVGEQFGANGVEVSAHFDCAEDHLDIQGKQYTNKQFDRINGMLDRPIGEYNCRHFVFSIILGVSQPNYSKKELNQMERESLQKQEYEGVQYTKYEATQKQRQLETAIRRNKDKQIINRASGNENEAIKYQKKINELTYKYNDFSSKMGLKTYKENITVSGYRKIATK